MFLNKYILGTVAGILILASIAGAIYQWHYKPLKVLTKENTQLNTDLIEQTTLLGACYLKVKAVGVENYQEGLGEHDENTKYDIDNLISG